MKVKIYFRGNIKGSWILDFKDSIAFTDYYNTNYKNIEMFEILK